MDNPLKAIVNLGQSIWYDNLSRELLKSGELLNMIENDGISGVTTNPTIFEKAISNERIYDGDIHVLVDTGKNLQGIYEDLVLGDIREAADILSPVYEATKGRDGYVSLEVSPHLAYDAEKTVEEAKRLFAMADRRNVMIKIPATDQGFIAVEELIAQGVNVNVTLIFSLSQYNGAAKAYIRGLKRWIDSGADPSQPYSVASFFISRIDTMIDEMLKEVGEPEAKTVARALLGKAGIANARLANAMSKDIFLGEEFASLKEKGAKPQRLLWASTSAKNPEYPDIYYVDALIGPETINTIPPATLNAFRDHGRPQVRIEDDMESVKEVFPLLERLEISLNEVMGELLSAGVKAFAESYDLIFQSIAMKRTRLLRGWGHRSASLGDLQKPVDNTLIRFDKEKISEGLWSCDVSLWTEDPEIRSAIAQRLGWLNIVEVLVGETQRLRDFANEVRSAGFKTAVLIGMGGSSLASEVFITCFGAAEGFLDLKVLDTTIPGAILKVERELDLKTTLFIVSSKSGGTIEVVSLFNYFWDKMKKLLGNKAGSNFIAITDPGTGLGKLAAEKKFRKTFLNPPDIGGRFSALSYFGLVPAVLVGMDVDRLLMRASQAVEAAGAEVPALENQGLWLGACMAEASMAGRDKLSLIISPKTAAFGLWLEQLVAESTGKHGVGILPVDGEPLGGPDLYGADRLFVYLRIDDEGVYDEKVSALESSGQPVITLRLHTPFDLGREIFRWELATATAGLILKINPFDEPNVTESKNITKKILSSYDKEGKLPEDDFPTADDTDLSVKLRKFLGAAKSGDYVAFNAFIQPSKENLETLQTMRSVVRDNIKIATTVGFGPRYLHSTGQYHKGGPDKGLFIQITCDDTEDLSIPGAGYSFGILKAAQSMGDYAALKNKGRRIIRVHLKRESDLTKLSAALKAAFS